MASPDTLCASLWGRDELPRSFSRLRSLSLWDRCPALKIRRVPLRWLDQQVDEALGLAPHYFIFLGFAGIYSSDKTILSIYFYLLISGLRQKDAFSRTSSQEVILEVVIEVFYR
jgi:hypothetical protein